MPPPVQTFSHSLLLDEVPYNAAYAQNNYHNWPIKPKGQNDATAQETNGYVSIIKPIENVKSPLGKFSYI